MTTLLIAIHVIVGIFLIGIVLLQSGKAGSIADVFGGGASMAAFGARGAATMLSRITTVAAVLFFVTSLGLSLMKTEQRSLMSNQPVKKEAPKNPVKKEAPKTPAPEATAPVAPAPETPAPPPPQ